MANILRNKWLYAILIAAGAAWWWFGGSGDHKSATSSVRVTVAEAGKQDVPTLVPLVGSVVPYETVAIKARLDSQITDVLFKDGDEVKEGQKLFVLDDRAVKADIKQMEASLAKEKATLVNAKLQYDRMDKLVKSNAVSQAAADEAKATYEAQAAQVGVAQANVDNARVQLSYTHIDAPISGRTGTINVTRGNNVKANDANPLVTINQIAPIRVQFATPQRYYEQVRAAKVAGDVAVVATHKESGETAEGKLEYLDNNIDTSNGTFAARAVFANENEKLWPGMFVNVVLNLGPRKDVLTVPAVAIQGDEGKRFVFLIKDKKAIRTPVEISDNNGDIAIITSGVKEGDQVVTDGILRLTDGATVDVITPKDKPAEAGTAKP